MIARIMRPRHHSSGRGAGGISLGPPPSVEVEFYNFEEFVLAYRADVPGGGVFVESAEKLDLSEKVALKLTLSNGIKLIEGLGEIARILPCDLEGVWPVVVQFGTLQPKSAELLARLSHQFLRRA